jgi:quercetin dioxygenase-like cupin family protein
MTRSPSLCSKSVDLPDTTQVFLDGSERVVIRLGVVTIGRGVYRPGWRWSRHVRPLAGKGSAAHTGYVLSGRMIVRAQDGLEIEVGPGNAFLAAPGHDAWVTGDEPCVALDFAAGAGVPSQVE